LRGRDIKRYNYEFADQYIIATFPSRQYNIDNYQALRDYLLSFGKERLLLGYNWAYSQTQADVRMGEILNSGDLFLLKEEYPNLKRLRKCEDA